MNDVKIEDLQALQDKIDERAKAEANRFLSDFIVAGSTYIDGFAEAAANKIDADLVCKGYQPICQSPRDFLAVCAAKDALTEKMSSGKVIFTGLGINSSDCNTHIIKRELKINIDENGDAAIPIDPDIIEPISRCAAIGSGSAFYIPSPEGYESLLGHFFWQFDNAIALANPEAISDMLNMFNSLNIPTSKVFLTLCSDEGSDFVVFPPDYQRWFEETYACFG